jgi:hypothetical protein
MKNITVRPSSRFLRIVSNANPAGGIKSRDNAAFGVRPQGYGKETGWRIDWREGPVVADLASFLASPA